ncbi:MAG: N-acetylmuramoyl-L-alanine amidase [Bacteroidales bacterium]|nr:N-acetylmuramoyl-L-alanine amidase [Bacteroidales bacterium]
MVIDAGHGGHDPGSISPNRKVKEKNIALSVALKFGKLIEERYPDIQVIYTRKTDVFIPLNTRSDIANKNKADLFISIHVNSVKARSASGSETYVMGESKSSSNLEVTMKENSVISLEGDHQSVYEGFDPNNPESYIIFSLLQNAHLEQSLQMAEFVQEELGKGPVKINRGIKQGGLIVLWRSSMPAILVELGFISNPNDYLVLIQEDNQEKFANLLYKAFNKYKKAYESNNGEKVAVKSQDTVVKSEKVSSERKSSEKSKEIKVEEKTQEVKRDTLAEIRKALQKKSDIRNEVITEKRPDTTKSTLKAGKNNAQLSFRVQIMAVTRILPENAPDFKGEKNLKYIKVGNFYKYSVGEFSTKEEAEKELIRVKKKFPQAFIIKVENEN